MVACDLAEELVDLGRACTGRYTKSEGTQVRGWRRRTGDEAVVEELEARVADELAERVKYRPSLFLESFVSIRIAQ